MSYLQTISLFFALLGTIVIGCSSNDSTKQGTQNQQSADWKKGLDDEVVKAFSQLSDADRKSVLAQKMCPVADKKLGSMGEPVKVTVKGQDVFLCCASCEDAIKNDPDKFLAKLKKK